MEKYDTYSTEDAPCRKICLDRNFRSRPQVLDSVNDLFYRIMKRDVGGVEYDAAAALYPGADYPDAFETDAYKTRILLADSGAQSLEENGVVLFPDAPTERGVKHVQELCHCLEQGYEAAVVFVVQMSGMRYFTPNRRTHAAFAEALERAEACGVRMLALSCEVTPESLAINGEIPIHLAG